MAFEAEAILPRSQTKPKTVKLKPFCPEAKTTKKWLLLASSIQIGPKKYPNLSLSHNLQCFFQ